MSRFAPVCLTLALLCSAACAPRTPPAASPVQIGPLVLPGVPRALAEHRAATLSDVSYDLALDLTGPDWIHGAVTIFFTRAPGSGHLVIDFRGLAVTDLHANQQRVGEASWVNEHIIVPAEHLREGENAVDIRFMSAAAPSGASVIRFTEPADAASNDETPDTYYYSLLVPSDASQLFPSFDQPDLKATIRLELIAPPGSSLLSNGVLANRTEVDRGVWARFEPTAPISTYLAAFAAGPWTTWSDSSGPVPMTLYARRSRAAEVDVDSLMATTRQSLEWLQEYFRSDYPFGKFDFLLAPAFPFGGMEHPGAVFYNESRFIFRESPTLSERLARNATIYHEVAHQWFGDLVTMRWFDDLWLKEGFATYMAARMQDALSPGTGAWATFYLQNKPAAYRVDVTTGTTPVWQSLENLDLAKSNYGPIVYNKAPAILKQLNFLVGEENFRAGIRRLLRRHAFGNFDWQDMLAEMERTSGRSLRQFGEQYILRGGAPIIETQLVQSGGTIQELRLVQRAAVETSGVQGWWPGRVIVRLGYGNGAPVEIPVTFTGDTTIVAEARGRPVPDFVFPNAGDYGYGIFLLDAASADHLSAHVGAVNDRLLRTLIWGALWDLVRDGRLPPGEFVEVALRELPREKDEQIAEYLLGRTAIALQRYIPSTETGQRAILRGRFEQMLIDGLNDPTAGYDLRKARLDALLARARSESSLQLLHDFLAERERFDGEPLPQPSRWAAVRTLVALGHLPADSLLAAERERDRTPEGERQAFIAGAARPQPAAKADYFERYLDDPDLNEEWVTASLSAFNHPEHADLTSPYLARALERLSWIQQNRRIFFLPQWIDSFIVGQTDPVALTVVDEHLSAQRELSDDIRRKVLQARDELARTIRIRGGARNTGP